MTETRPARPALATLICIWEVLAVLVPVAAHFAVRLFHRASLLAPTRASTVHVSINVLGYLLAIASAIALWQMMRAAFYLLAARFVLSLLLPLAALLQNDIHLSPIRLLAFAISIALNASIAWYAHTITLRKSPPLPVALERTPSNISISEFYLAASDEERRRPR